MSAAVDLRGVFGALMHSRVLWLPPLQGAREAVEENQPCRRRGTSASEFASHLMQALSVLATLVLKHCRKCRIRCAHDVVRMGCTDLHIDVTG